MGQYVTIEGIDGAGTTSVAADLAGRFTGAVLTEEPKEELLTGRAVREALRADTEPETDVFLFLADRSEHLAEVVEPALADDRLVISDRGADSTYAYQSGRLGDSGRVGVEPFEWLDELYAGWNRQPDLTLYLDVPVDTALARIDPEEKFETRGFLKRARDGYERVADRHSHRYARVDASQPLEDVVDAAERALWDNLDEGGLEEHV